MEHSPPEQAVSDAFARRFGARAGGAGAVLTFAAFMDLALYDPEVGYYRAARPRVGRSQEADFYTASSFGGVFGMLVAAAATQLLGAERAAQCEFVEIGAEPGHCILDGVHHGFHAVRTVRIGEPLELTGDLVVFSNELFDAQAFHRVVRRGGSWREMGVGLARGRLEWEELPAVSASVAGIAARLPATAPEGYVLDLPIAAETLARGIASQTWSGLFLALDYGRTWTQLAHDFPAGTGRAYAQHRQSDDLLAQPGAQDLTCHVCWDWLESALRDAGFASLHRESQEAFLVHHAAPAIEQLVATDANPLSRTRSQLRHLLHPAIMGQRFEALWALRANGSQANRVTEGTE